MNNIEIKEVDLSTPEHVKAMLRVLNNYARDPMGLGKPLDNEVESRLAGELRKQPGLLCLLAYCDGTAAGIANCFYGFSTFRARKLLNIHDLAVDPGFRGKGIGAALLRAVEEKARESDCCRVTLEVREDNRARRLYERSGFRYGDPKMYFMTKKLT